MNEKLRKQIDEFVKREVAKAPPLTPEQIAVISRAIHGSRASKPEQVAKSADKPKDEWDV